MLIKSVNIRVRVCDISNPLISPHEVYACRCHLDIHVPAITKHDRHHYIEAERSLGRLFTIIHADKTCAWA